MHHSGADHRIHLALVTAAVASLAIVACSQATTAGSSRTENVVRVSAPTTTGHQTQTIRYETDINAASTQLDLPAGLAWQRVSRAYTALRIPGTVLDSAVGVVGARGARVHARLAREPLPMWFQCGRTPIGTPRADSYTLFVTIMTQVNPAATSSTARTIVSATAEANDSPSGAVPCSSTGRLEQRLASAFTSD